MVDDASDGAMTAAAAAAHQHATLPAVSFSSSVSLTVRCSSTGWAEAMSERKSDSKEDDAMEVDSKSSASSSFAAATVDYVLSAELKGHAYAVRDVAVADDALLATLEEKGKAHIFTLTPPPSNGATAVSSPSQWIEQHVLPHNIHLSMAFVLELVRPRSASTASSSSAHSLSAPQPSHYPALTFMSGGGDKAARPFTANGSILDPLEPHGGPVNSIAVLSDGSVVTGAWDGIIRVWSPSTGRCVAQVAGHEHGVEVCVLDGDRVVSGSGNKAIHLIDNGKVVRRIANAHNHSIRKLIAHPLGFASAGNDGRIKVWTRDGDELQVIDAHTDSGEQAPHVYGLALNPLTDELVSCGEMGVRVWRGTQCVQSLPHPGTVRAVKVLPSGDIVTACADRIARIWTRSVERYASEAARHEYEEMSKLMAAAGGGMEALDDSTLPDESVIETRRGTKDGEVLVVNRKGTGGFAYQWSDEAQAWVEVGAVMGKKGSGGGGGGKQVLDGKEYDNITEVYISDTQSVKLGINRDDDPLDVADRFCALYDLPADAKGQIVAHVRPMTDERLIAERKQREADEAEAAALKQVPGWLRGGAEVYATMNAKGMRDKLTEGNTALQSLTAAEVKTINGVIDELSIAQTLHAVEWSRERTRVVVKLLQWPSEWSAPVLDCVRVAMVSSGGVESLGEDEEVHRLMRQQVERGKEVQLLLYVKTMCNYIAKRKRSKTERASPPSVDAAVLARLLASLTTIQSALRGSAAASERVWEGYVMLLHNVVSWLGRMGVDRGGVVDVYDSVVGSVVDGLRDGRRSSKVEYYGLLCVGSIVYAVRRMRDVVVGKYGKELKVIVDRAKGNDNPAVREVAADVERLYGLSTVQT